MTKRPKSIREVRTVLSKARQRVVKPYIGEGVRGTPRRPYGYSLEKRAFVLPKDVEELAAALDCLSEELGTWVDDGISRTASSVDQAARGQDWEAALICRSELKCAPAIPQTGGRALDLSDSAARAWPLRMVRRGERQGTSADWGARGVDHGARPRQAPGGRQPVEPRGALPEVATTATTQPTAWQDGGRVLGGHNWPFGLNWASCGRIKGAQNRHRGPQIWREWGRKVPYRLGMSSL